MTLPRLQGMGRYWKENPPLHVMVAAYLMGSSESGGKGRKGRKGGSRESTAKLDDLIREFESAGINVVRQKQVTHG